MTGVCFCIAHRNHPRRRRRRPAAVDVRVRCALVDGPGSKASGRSGAKLMQPKSSHAVRVSHPKEFARLIKTSDTCRAD